MSEETLVQLCAPTLAGLKTGNLFAAEYHSPQEVRDQVEEYRRLYDGQKGENQNEK